MDMTLLSHTKNNTFIFRPFTALYFIFALSIQFSPWLSVKHQRHSNTSIIIETIISFRLISMHCQCNCLRFRFRTEVMEQKLIWQIVDSWGVRFRHKTSLPILIESICRPNSILMFFFFCCWFGCIILMFVQSQFKECGERKWRRRKNNKHRQRIEGSLIARNHFSLFHTLSKMSDRCWAQVFFFIAPRTIWFSMYRLWVVVCIHEFMAAIAARGDWTCIYFASMAIWSNIKSIFFIAFHSLNCERYPNMWLNSLCVYVILRVDF